MDIIDIFEIGIYVFAGIIVILSVMLIFFYNNKKGLFAAAEVIETEGKKAGISDANMELIKAKILGLKVVSDE